MKKTYIIVSILLLITLLVVPLAFILLRTNSETLNVSTNSQSVEDTVEVDPFHSSIYYVHLNNVHFLHEDNSIKLTDFPESEDWNFTEITRFGDKLGFGVCATELNNFGCEIMLVNINTQELVTIFSLTPDDLLENLTFHSENTYAFDYFRNGNSWILELHSNGTRSQLHNIEFDGYGRNRSINDADYLSFSPEGNHLLQIATDSPRSQVDFNTYIYDVDTREQNVVSNATHPTWATNDSIIFKNYPDGGLSSYNIENSSTQAVDESASALIIERVGNLILYLAGGVINSVGNDSITNLNDGAVYKFRGYDNLVVYQITEPCLGPDCLGRNSDYQLSEYLIMDTLTGELLDLEIPKDTVLFHKGMF